MFGVCVGVLGARPFCFPKSVSVCFVVPIVCFVLFPNCLFVVLYFFVYVCVLLC